MSADGESLLTSVGAQDATIWLHDPSGDHQLSSEGSAFGTTLSQDKTKLYYVLLEGEQSPGNGLWVRDLVSGTSERVASGSAIQPGAELQYYSLSQDGKTVAISVKDEPGVPHLWLAPVDHRSSPRLLASGTGEDSAWFLPNGDLVLRSIEGSQNFLYLASPDGTGRHPTPEAHRGSHPRPNLGLSRRPLGSGNDKGQQRRTLGRYGCLPAGGRASRSCV